MTFLRPPPTPGPFGRDFEAYYSAGAVWNAGGDPWSRDVWRVERTIPGVDARRDELLPFVGPPAALPLWSLFARLPFAAARDVWELILGCSAFGLVFCALALATRTPSRGTIAAAVVLVALGGPLLSAIFLGQVALVSAAALAAAFLALRERPALAGPAAFVAALQPNLTLPLAVELRDRRAALILVGAAAVFVAVSLAVAGDAHGIAAYIHRLSAHGARERFTAIQYTVQALFFGAGLPRNLAELAGGACAVIAAAVVAIAALDRRFDAARTAWLAVALLPLAEPFFHEHDFVIVAIPAVGLALTGDARARALAGIGTVAAFVDWFGMAQRPPAQGQIAALALGVACAFAALAYRRGDDLRSALAPLAAAVALILICLPLAATHPAPTWPDALGTYRAPPAADVSDVWGEEQRLSGLGRVEPVWSLLRAVPLLGCVLLAVASWREQHCVKQPAGATA